MNDGSRLAWLLTRRQNYQIQNAHVSFLLLYIIIIITIIIIIISIIIIIVVVIIVITSECWLLSIAELEKDHP